MSLKNLISPFVDTFDSLVRNHKLEEISGFTTSSVITTPLVMSGLITSLFQAALIALVTGAVGAIGAHYAKKLIAKFKL